ncbi:unnamed protein product [Boreogadus saida]
MAWQALPQVQWPLPGLGPHRIPTQVQWPLPGQGPQRTPPRFSGPCLAWGPTASPPSLSYSPSQRPQSPAKGRVGPPGAPETAADWLIPRSSPVNFISEAILTGPSSEGPYTYSWA